MRNGQARKGRSSRSRTAAARGRLAAGKSKLAVLELEASDLRDRPALPFSLVSCCESESHSCAEDRTGWTESRQVDVKSPARKCETQPMREAIAICRLGVSQLRKTLARKSHERGGDREEGGWMISTDHSRSFIALLFNRAIGFSPRFLVPKWTKFGKGAFPRILFLSVLGLDGSNSISTVAEPGELG